MKHKFSVIEDAFFYVSSAQPTCHNALICRKTGKAFYGSELGDSDEDYPYEADDDEYIFIPHANDLDLGSNLVFSFAREKAPHLAEEIRGIFSRRGAYGRFKGLLEHHDLLKTWHDYEAEKTTEKLREWCADNNIDVTP